jgi:hypothetical protein
VISQKRFMDQKIREIGHASIIQLADIYTQVNTGQDFVLYLGLIKSSICTGISDVTAVGESLRSHRLR